MRRMLFFAMVALSVFVIAAPAAAASNQEFKAQFHDDDCVTHTLCGTGLVEGYGHVTTTVDITGADFDPTTGCLINVAAVRNVELLSDPSSTLSLGLTDGMICGNKGFAAFTITSGTGVFAGLHVLPGTVRVTAIQGVPADTAQFRATIAP